MGQLTGGVAHDFNNLLTPIIGSLDMLMRRGLGNERERRLIDGALQSADRAKTLVQRLLAFARRQPLQAVAVDLSALITGIIGLVESTTGPKIRVEVKLENALPSAKADPNQIEMAILNLAVNARDAMVDGGTLHISAAAETVKGGHKADLKSGDYVCLSIADTGTGMDEATLARAIEPFFSTKGVGQGTGLGLSMAHGLASQLGGALTIQSQPDIGTTVKLYLPVTEQAFEPTAKAIPRRFEPSVRGTALLVDDEVLVRMSTADMLTDLGFHVVEAASAEDALSSIKSGLRPDVLLTDHLMPGMTGTELAGVVREQLPSTPILVISGYAEMNGLSPDLPRLVKPFRSDELAAGLAKLLPRQ